MWWSRKENKNKTKRYIKWVDVDGEVILERDASSSLSGEFLPSVGAKVKYHDLRATVLSVEIDYTPLAEVFAIIVIEKI